MKKRALNHKKRAAALAANQAIVDARIAVDAARIAVRRATYWGASEVAICCAWDALKWASVDVPAERFRRVKRNS